MKKLLLIGTALLSIAPYAGAMNFDQEGSKQKRTLQDLQPDNQESSKQRKILLQDCCEELEKCLQKVAVNEKLIISPSDWERIVSKILDILKNDTVFARDPENKECWKELSSQLDRLDENNISYQGFELQAAEQVEQLYEVIQNNLVLSNICKGKIYEGSSIDEHFIQGIIQKLFYILVIKQNAEIGSDLASKLLKDQDISNHLVKSRLYNHFYLGLNTISYLIVPGKGSLNDIIFSQKGSLSDKNSLDSLKDIIGNIILQQWRDSSSLYKAKEIIEKEKQERTVNEKISIFQTKIIQPLKEFINKEVDKKIIDPLEKIELFKQLLSSMSERASGLKRGYGSNSIEYLYCQELEKLINSCLKEPLIQAGKESVSASTLAPSK